MKQVFGRSMVEMLSVLALVGILSLTGLITYRIAINRYRANNTAYDVGIWAMRATENTSKFALGQIIPTEDIGYISSMGYGISAIFAGSDLFAVELVDVPSAVCKPLLKLTQHSYVVEVSNSGMGNGVLFLDDVDVCGTQKAPRLYFYFTRQLQKPNDKCLPACGDGESCCNNTCYPSSGICGNTCSCPIETECKGEICCAWDVVACGKICCPKSRICKQGACVCPEGAILNNEDQCVCPAGSILIDNKCQSLICIGSGSNHICTDIYGKRCGTRCNADGSTCGVGYCQNYCPRGTTYEYIDASVIQETWRGNVYGCVDSTKEVFCIKQNVDICWRNGQICGYNCRMDGQNCSEGACFNNCPEGWIYKHDGKKDTSGGYGCEKNNENFICKVTGEQYYGCFKNGVKCADRCIDLTMSNCSYNLCENSEGVCPEGTSYVSGEKFVGCQSPDGIVCTGSLSSSTCYLSISSSSSCAIRCSSLKSEKCEYGTCKNDCPSGLTYLFEQATSWGYGCRNETSKVQCIQANGKYVCYKDGVGQCGSNCSDYYGTGCPGCMEITCPAGTTVDENFCYNPQLDTLCHFLGDYCSIKSTGMGCGYTCSSDGTNCVTGLCEPEKCPSGTAWGKQALPHSGCISESSPVIACYKTGSCYVCYKDWTVCGKNCSDYTGAGCPECSVAEDEVVSCPEGTLYQTTTGLCASADTSMGCVKINNIWNCTTCAIGSTYGQIDETHYGCINDNGTRCYQDGETTFTCIKNGSVCGTGCSEAGTGGTCDTNCS